MSTLLQRLTTTGGVAVRQSAALLRASSHQKPVAGFFQSASTATVRALSVPLTSSKPAQEANSVRHMSHAAGKPFSVTGPFNFHIEHKVQNGLKLQQSFVEKMSLANVIQHCANLVQRHNDAPYGQQEKYQRAYQNFLKQLSPTQVMGLLNSQSTPHYANVLPFAPIYGEGSRLVLPNDEFLLDANAAYATGRIGYGAMEKDYQDAVRDTRGSIPSRAVYSADAAGAHFMINNMFGHVIRKEPGESAVTGVLSTGGEITDTAFQTATRYAMNKYGVRREDVTTILLEDCFHGRTNTTGAQHTDDMPLEARDHLGRVKLPGNDERKLEQFVNHEVSQGRIVNLILEPITGEGGVTKKTPTFVEMVNRLRDEGKIKIVIADEVQTGFKGTNPSASHEIGLRPDILLVAKCTTNGTTPLSGLVTSEEVGRLGLEPGTSGGTFSAHPIASKMAMASLFTWMRKGPDEKSNLQKLSEVGDQIRAVLEEASKAYPGELEVSGSDSMLGFKFIDPKVGKLVHDCMLHFRPALAAMGKSEEFAAFAHKEGLDRSYPLEKLVGVVQKMAGPDKNVMRITASLGDPDDLKALQCVLKYVVSLAMDPKGQKEIAKAVKVIKEDLDAKSKAFVSGPGVDMSQVVFHSR